MTYVRSYTIWVYHRNSYNFPHLLPTISSLTSLEDWLVLEVINLIF